MKITLDPGAHLPTRAHDTDAGLDLRAPFLFTIPAHCRAKIDTGVHVLLPHGTVGYVRSKSGLMANRGIFTDGTVDEGYTGSIGVVLENTSGFDVSFMPGDKIAQLVVQPVLYPEIELVDSLDDSDRGQNGFGSTGR